MDLAADNFIIEVINFIEKEGAYNLLYENHGQTIDFISKFNRSHPGISMQLIRGTYINFWIAIYYKKMQFQNETSFTENILNSVKYKNRIKFHTEENDKNIKYNTVLIHFDIEEKAEYAYISDILIKVQKKKISIFPKK
ncbi:MAG: hypothetical protein M0D57_09120 [Sphingobacteriales bacterium JAD_PAG50586_3]|nr:MAG: hypothetical protein M0D57_09120 [Sphingobacteriales bacterium JAD_PAG50586_3]